MLAKVIGASAAVVKDHVEPYLLDEESKASVARYQKGPVQFWKKKGGAYTLYDSPKKGAQEITTFSNISKEIARAFEQVSLEQLMHRPYYNGLNDQERRIGEVQRRALIGRRIDEVRRIHLTLVALNAQGYTTEDTPELAIGHFGNVLDWWPLSIRSLKKE